MVAENKLPRTLIEAVRYFDAESAYAYVKAVKWPDGPVCEHCGSVNVGEIRSRARFQCRDCRKQFSLITGTIMEGTHLALPQWILGVWQIVNCRNGVSSCEMARNLGCKQHSAWHLLHRVRHILKQENTEKFSGTVEADSTFVGGLVKNMPLRRRKARTSKDPHSGKAVVHAIRERSTGRVRAKVIPAETLEVVEKIITENVEPGSRLHTDSSHVYTSVGRYKGFRHDVVNHTRKEYVRGDVTTNGTESFFNCLRRGLKGTYIRPSPEHLQLYVDEVCYRYSVRKDADWTRFDNAMRMIVGKRLTYSELTDGCVR